MFSVLGAGVAASTAARHLSVVYQAAPAVTAGLGKGAGDTGLASGGATSVALSARGAPSGPCVTTRASPARAAPAPRPAWHPFQYGREVESTARPYAGLNQLSQVAGEIQFCPSLARQQL